MIDPMTDPLVPLSAACEMIPVHRSTVCKWASRGVDGVVLESVWIGKLRFTTRKAVAEFVERCTAAREKPEPAPRPRPAFRPRRTRTREEEILAAEAKLREMGVG